MKLKLLSFLLLFSSFLFCQNDSIINSKLPIINIGIGANLGYRSPYDNAGFTGSIQLFATLDIYGFISQKGWATGIKMAFTNKNFKPVLGLSYSYLMKQRHEFGTENNYTYYQSDAINYITPEIGCKKRIYADNKNRHFIEGTLCLNYRISNKENKVYYLSGNPIKNSFVKQMNFEIADGLGINISISYYFFKSK